MWLFHRRFKWLIDWRLAFWLAFSKTTRELPPGTQLVTIYLSYDLFAAAGLAHKLLNLVSLLGTCYVARNFGPWLYTRRRFSLAGFSSLSSMPSSWYEPERALRVRRDLATMILVRSCIIVVPWITMHLVSRGPPNPVNRGNSIDLPERYLRDNGSN